MKTRDRNSCFSCYCCNLCSTHSVSNFYTMIYGYSFSVFVTVFFLTVHFKVYFCPWFTVIIQPLHHFYGSHTKHLWVSVWTSKVFYDWTETEIDSLILVLESFGMIPFFEGKCSTTDESDTFDQGEEKIKLDQWASELMNSKESLFYSQAQMESGLLSSRLKLQTWDWKQSQRLSQTISSFCERRGAAHLRLKDLTKKKVSTD